MRSLQRSGLPENGCSVFLKRSRNPRTLIGRHRDRQKAWGSTREASHFDDVSAFDAICESLVIHLATPPFGRILFGGEDPGRDKFPLPLMASRSPCPISRLSE